MIQSSTSPMHEKEAGRKTQGILSGKNVMKSAINVDLDDRDKVVAMWRRHGLTCVQVAPDDF